MAEKTTTDTVFALAPSLLDLLKSRNKEWRHCYLFIYFDILLRYRASLLNREILESWWDFFLFILNV